MHDIYLTLEQWYRVCSEVAPGKNITPFSLAGYLEERYGARIRGINGDSLVHIAFNNTKQALEFVLKYG